MSNHKSKTIEVPPFDALLNNPSPFQGFGPPLADISKLETEFRAEAVNAFNRLQGGFGINKKNKSELSDQLDKVIATMWETGWNPNIGNINLFARDFGIVLAVNLLDKLGGQLIFRSEKDINHVSIFWVNARVEAFPFHKALKCLFHKEGETMASFARGIASEIAEK